MVFSDYIILYTENTINCTKKILELMNEFREVAGYKSVCINWLHFYTLIMNYEKEKFRKQSHVQMHPKNTYA